MTTSRRAAVPRGAPTADRSTWFAPTVAWSPIPAPPGSAPRMSASSREIPSSCHSTSSTYRRCPSGRPSPAFSTTWRLRWRRCTRCERALPADGPEASSLWVAGRWNGGSVPACCRRVVSEKLRSPVQGATRIDVDRSLRVSDEGVVDRGGGEVEERAAVEVEVVDPVIGDLDREPVDLAALEEAAEEVDVADDGRIAVVRHVADDGTVKVGREAVLEVAGQEIDGVAGENLHIRGTQSLAAAIEGELTVVEGDHVAGGADGNLTEDHRRACVVLELAVVDLGGVVDCSKGEPCVVVVELHPVENRDVLPAVVRVDSGGASSGEIPDQHPLEPGGRREVEVETVRCRSISLELEVGEV